MANNRPACERGSSLLAKGLIRALLVLTGLPVIPAAPLQKPSPIELYVSPSGRDSWPGSVSQPLETLEGARNRLRVLRAGGKKARGARVRLKGGDYRLARPFLLEGADGGTPEAPIVYEGISGEKVRVLGGMEVKGFQRSVPDSVLPRLAPAARGNVVWTSLGNLDLGRHSRRGKGLPLADDGVPELYFRRKPMTLARWPNQGFAQIQALPGGDQGLRFQFKDERLRNWSKEDDLWAHGYWRWDWADYHLAVGAVDPGRGVVTLSPPQFPYGLKEGGRFIVENALCELDQPGEYYIDRSAHRLYFWPPEAVKPGDVEISTLPVVLRTENCSWVQFLRMDVELARKNVVEILGGQGVLLSGCGVRNVGGWGIQASGLSHRIEACEIETTGEGGLRLEGGDRMTLTPGLLEVAESHIHHVARWSWTYFPGIRLEGVGNRITRNHIHDAPHSAILFWGNDHLIEGNEIHHVCTETGDAGAIYTGRDWTARGTVLRHNFLHHIEGVGHFGAMGIYLDDLISGIEIRENIFFKTSRGVILSGRDNLIQGNHFVSCGVAITVYWGKNPIPRIRQDLERALRAVPYDSTAYAKYPHLADVLQDDPYVPKRNRLAFNLISAGELFDDYGSKSRPWVEFDRNAVFSSEDIYARPERLRGGWPRPSDFVLNKRARTLAPFSANLPLEKFPR